MLYILYNIYYIIYIILYILDHSGCMKLAFILETQQLTLLFWLLFFKKYPLFLKKETIPYFFFLALRCKNHGFDMPFFCFERHIFGFEMQKSWL